MVVGGGCTDAAAANSAGTRCVGMVRDTGRLGAAGAPFPDDTELLQQVQRGDEQALASLFDRYSRVVYSVSLRVLRDPASAEDVLQEVFLQIWRSPEAFLSTRGSLSGWLAVVARNRSIDVLRRRRPSEVVDEIMLPSTFDLAEDSERTLMVERARVLMGQMPVEQRRALEMAFFDGLTHAEIAEMTGVPLGTVKTRIRSALKALRLAFRV